MVNIIDSRAAERVDIGPLYRENISWALLNPLYRIHVLLAYQTCRTQLILRIHGRLGLPEILAVAPTEGIPSKELGAHSRAGRSHPLLVIYQNEL